MQSKTKVNKPHNEITKALPRISEARRIQRVMFSRWMVVFGTFVILALLVVAIFAPLIAPYDPDAIDLGNTLQQPSREHILGTDKLGRDVLSRILYGTRLSLIIGIVSVSIACGIGIPLGLAAGYFSRLVNNVIMRIVDAIMVFPPTVLALAIAATLGGGTGNVIISIGISLMPTYCRLMCGHVLSIKGNEYITATRVFGATDARIIFFHCLPNSFPPMLVLITLNLGVAILTEAGLSFLGVGITPPAATWGSMVKDGYRYLLGNPLLSIAPGGVVMLVVLSFSMVGDGLRDALDPRLRGTL